MRLIGDTHFNFIGMRKVAYVISAILIITGAISLAVKGGPNLGIDFVGGTAVSLEFPSPIPTGGIRNALSKNGIENEEIQSFAGNKSAIIRVKEASGSEQEVGGNIIKALFKEFPDNQPTLKSSLLIGPSMGSYLFNRAILAMVFSFIGIVAYVALRFHGVKYGVAGVVALVHDVFITLGIFSLADKEISISVVAAFLTVAGYSINDTIVIYDRIRETTRSSHQGIDEAMNISLNRTLSRTIITSMTTLFVLIALFFLGGEVLHDFAFALIVGVAIGTYSSVFVASPIVFDWQSWTDRRKKTKIRLKGEKRSVETSKARVRKAKSPSN